MKEGDAGRIGGTGRSGILMGDSVNGFFSHTETGGEGELISLRDRGRGMGMNGGDEDSRALNKKIPSE